MEAPESKYKKQDEWLQAGTTGASAEIVQRYGSAIKEHLVAYSGEDHEFNQVLAKGLKGISEYDLNPDYIQQNIKQQAGFSAEVKTQARERAEQIIAGETPARSTRTDDVTPQSDGHGHNIGGRNDQLYDMADVTPDGFYIEGSGRQLKYIGDTPEECCKKLLGKKMDKYRDADVPVEVPSDFYDSIKEELAQRAEKLSEQIAKAEARGDSALAAKHRAQLDRVQKANESLRKGKLTSKEAVEARTNPVLSTAKDTAKIAHQAGVQSAKLGAVLNGSASIVKNLVLVIRDEKEPEEAALAVAKDTATAAATSYAIAFTGSAIKGAMQNANKDAIRVLSHTNLPAVLVDVSLQAGRTMVQYFKGELNGLECLEQLGEQGTGMIASALFATVGAAIIPGLGGILGGLIGGMVGYAISSASYGILVNSLKEQKLAHEERLQIESACQAHIKLIQQYRQEMQNIITKQLSSDITIFQAAFDDMKSALQIGDVDGFISATNQITKSVGKKPVFSSISELNQLMGQSNAITL